MGARAIVDPFHCLVLTKSSGSGICKIKNSKMNNNQQLKKLALNIRVLSAAGVEKANSGHPGMPMGTADIAAVMWSEFLKFNPADTAWLGRDRFVLSAGHGSMLLYSLLHLFQFNLPMEELKKFRQFGSLTPGHPEFGVTSGVEVTTGPLGQGFANGVGMALSAKMYQAKYQTDLLAHNIYGIVSDGDLMEGVTAEAASLAGHWKLDNLIYVYDDNDISIGGHTDICFTEDVPARFRAYGWKVYEVDGHDFDQLRTALTAARDQKEAPALICAHTKIGFGSPNKNNTAEVHGAPLGREELELSKKNLGWTHAEEFFVDPDVRVFCQQVIDQNQKTAGAWEQSFKDWQKSNVQLATKLQTQLSKEISAELENELFAELGKIEKDATRNISGKAIQVIAKHLPGFAGGSADLEPSTKTLIKDSGDVEAGSFVHSNLRYGVREHAMGSIANGFAYSGGWFPYTATFLVFSDYMRPPMRLAALSHLQSLFIFTHDSFFVGEDGPTHQPIEHLSVLRAIPRLDVYRPADGLETAACYISSLKRQNHPAALLFTRQAIPALQREAGVGPAEIAKGGYVVAKSEVSDLVLIASGSEVSLAQESAKALEENQGIKARVVSIPCLEIFLEQDLAYQEKVIPNSATKVLIEAGSSWGWGNVLGKDVVYITKDSYGASAPDKVLAKEFGFSVENVVAQVLKKIKK